MGSGTPPRRPAYVSASGFGPVAVVAQGGVGCAAESACGSALRESSVRRMPSRLLALTFDAQRPGSPGGLLGQRYETGGRRRSSTSDAMHASLAPESTPSDPHRGRDPVRCPDSREPSIGNTERAMSGRHTGPRSRFLLRHFDLPTARFHASPSPSPCCAPIHNGRSPVDPVPGAIRLRSRADVVMPSGEVSAPCHIRRSGGASAGHSPKSPAKQALPYSQSRTS